MALLEIENLAFAYDRHNPVLRNLNLSLEQRCCYAIVGRSGAGKTTLLSLISGLLKPVRGRILFNGHDIAQTNQFVYRSRDIGVVFQSYNLLPKLTAEENVILSMDISPTRIRNKKERARELLRLVGLKEDEMKRRVLLLSGGQQQRVAIARAISFNPMAILADEPTGNLDMVTSNEIMNLLRQLAHEQGKCVVVVTHSPFIASKADVVIDLSDYSASVERNGESDASVFVKSNQPVLKGD